MATDSRDDPRFRDRTPGVRAPRRISRERADQDTAGIIGSSGTTGGGQPGSPGQPADGRVPDDELDDTVYNSRDPYEPYDPNPLEERE
ncbi:hypothetical protein D5H75_34570 [Bailinhaonella thermotolerans]|uniref:Uncharacterized protein n=2 Tax=Bailinhaonella thermotolerans TaxID=1070861 RepID=A0A3A4A9K1_9ACTN|nr:hypothetical protein D5H75_34570 [Bailinhaonella thermotolerans]